jgi:hypothetical protein
MFALEQGAPRMKVLRSFILGLLVPAALAAQTQESIQSAAASITAEDMIHRIGVIAHDSMMGRDTPSPGLDMTAEYIAREFQRFGLTPGGDEGTFIQRYEIRQIALNVEASEIRVAGGATWRAGDDFVPRFGTAPQPIRGTPVVLDGRTGSMTAVEEIEPGSIVFAVMSPGRATQQMFQAVFAREPGAVVLVGQPRDDRSWNRMVARVGRPQSQVGDPEGGFFALEIRDDVLRPFLSEHGYDLSAVLADTARPFTVTPLNGLAMTIDLQYDVVATLSAPNTVGILEGSDPTLKDEYIVFSGHMDHVGVGSPVEGDSIFNGADDDASGTIAVVELAEAFSKLDPRPKRSMIFVAVSGEEKGLWGSEYFTTNPPVAIEQMVADFNADMVGRNWTDTIVVIGKEHSDLGETMNRVNAEHPELNMTAIDDIWPEENFYQRSDHYNFAQRGVPVLFFFNGTHEDYHGVNDEVEKIDGDKASRITQLMFYLGLEVANAPEKPKWKEEVVP